MQINYAGLEGGVVCEITEHFAKHAKRAELNMLKYVLLLVILHGFETQALGAKFNDRTQAVAAVALAMWR